MWKNFFYFTKTERQGIIVLAVLILGVFALPALFIRFSPSQEPDAAEQELFRKEYDAFISSLKETKSGQKMDGKFTRDSPRREINLAVFDPNTADSTTFLSLGLPSWMIKNILRYREKQGRFHRPEDFRKIYGLTEEQYQTLFPYIRITKSRQSITDSHQSIAENHQSKDTMQLLTVQNDTPRDTLFKYQPGTVICLNSADTTELKKIPGIGSSIARKIVNYRKRLGAFHRIEQLQEIQLKAEKLRPWFSIDAGRIRRINLNKASMERMMHHPYINFYQAKAIIEYRKKKGNINSLKQLSLYDEFTPADFERLEPYVCYDL